MDGVSSLAEGCSETFELLVVSEMLGTSEREGSSSVSFALSLILGERLSLSEGSDGSSHPVRKRQESRIRKCFLILFPDVRNHSH